VVLTAAEWERLPGRKSQSGPESAGDVRFLLDEASHVILSVKGAAGGFLLLADSFMPGWSATVDGQDAPILRGDLCFRAVPVPEGVTSVSRLSRGMAAMRAGR